VLQIWQTSSVEDTFELLHAVTGQLEVRGCRADVVSMPHAGGCLLACVLQTAVNGLAAPRLAVLPYATLEARVRAGSSSMLRTCWRRVLASLPGAACGDSLAVLCFHMAVSAARHVAPVETRL